MEVAELVSDRYIPAGTTILVPQYSIMRGESFWPDKTLRPLCPGRRQEDGPMAYTLLDERNFARPDEWIPEQFTTHPDLILDKSAFVPWSIGECQKSLTV